NYEIETGDIKFKKYDDKNGSGLKASSEDYISGWTIRLYDANWQFVSELVSESDSSYDNEVFEDLPLGTYYLCEVSQTGWVQTEPAANAEVANGSSNSSEEAERCYEVELTRDGQEVAVRFGNHQVPTA